MTFPVRAVTEPSVLAGTSNGQLPASILVATPGQADGATVTLVEPAARAWRALCAAAKAAGHTLKTGWPSSSYRTYAEQERIFRERFTTTYLAGRPVRTWQGRKWYLKPGMALAAVPGTSNHGRALAVDTGEERDYDAGTESLDDPTLNWLIANEQRFGFSHEVQSEPWHLHYFAGDRIPQAVLDYEPSQHTAPEPSPPEAQMIWHIKDSPYTFLMKDAGFVALSEAEFWKLAGAGVPVKTVTNEQFLAANKQLHALAGRPLHPVA